MGNIEDKKQPENPVLVLSLQETNEGKTEVRNRNPFEGEDDRASPFVKDNDKVSVNEEEVSRKEQSCTTQQSSSAFSRCGERAETFEDYESVISDIEETLSILSRNSRSTTPVSELGYGSRTPTPSFGGNFFSAADLVSIRDISVADKHVIPVVTVFYDLKDYLSDSDVSLEYKIALQRRRHKNSKNLNKQAQLSSLLTSRKPRKLERTSSEGDGKPDLELTLARTTVVTKENESSRLEEDKSSADTIGSGGLKRRGSLEGSRSRRSPSATRATSLEPILEEQRGMRLSRQGNDALPDKIQPGEGSDGLSNRQTQGPVRVCVEKWENLFGTKTHLEGEIGGSPGQRKHLRTSSLSSLVACQNRNSPGPTFARTFQESSPLAPATRPTVNKSASECNLAQWVGRSSVKGREELKLITEYLGIDTSVVTDNLGVATTKKESNREDLHQPAHGNYSLTEKGKISAYDFHFPNYHLSLCPGMSVTRHEVAPLSDGLYYATPVLLADCSESDESDTDTDAQTVIHNSPQATPGGLHCIGGVVISHTITIKSDTPQLRWSPFPVCFSSANSNPTLPTDTALLPGVSSPTSSTTSPSSLHSLPFQLASQELGENDGDVGPASIPCSTFITTWGNPWGKAAHLSRLSTASGSARCT